MDNPTSLINLGDLAKPATALVEKISDAVGGAFRPFQIKRVAEAEAYAEVVKARTNIEINGLQQRALVRFVEEEAKKQENIESITAQSLKDLKEDAKPEDIENDWLSKFFDECRLVSDKEMQSLWSKLLAGEANQPGTFSKRTIEFVSNLDRFDADLFTKLCSFGFYFETGPPIICIYNLEDEIYDRKGITFSDLTHLDTIGLVKFNSVMSLSWQGLAEVTRINYYGTPIDIKFHLAENNQFNIGGALLTKIGEELAPICGSMGSDECIDHILGEWQKQGYITSCPLLHNL